MLLIWFLAGLPCCAETAPEYLNRAADTYKHLKSFQVETVTETTMAVGNRKIHVRVPMALYFVPPDKVRIESKHLENVRPSLLISNGRTVIEYNARKNEYAHFARAEMQLSFDPARGTGIGEMLYDTIADSVTNSTVSGRETLQVGNDRIDCVIIDVEYGQDSRIPKYSFWISEGNGLVFKRSVTFWDRGERKTLVSSVLALTLNEEISEAVFEFNPPPESRETPIGRVKQPLP